MNKFIKRIVFLSDEKIGGTAFSATIILYVIFAFVAQGAFSGLKDSSPILYHGILTLFSTIVLIGSTVFFYKDKFCGFVGIKKFNPLFLLASVLLTAGMFLAFGFVNNLVAETLMDHGIPVDVFAPSINTVTEYLLYTLILAVIPAIAEEIFFRGLLVGYTGDLSIVIRSLLIALLFGLFHCSIVKFGYQFLFGIGLTVLAVRAGSVIPAIIGHFLNNFAIVTFSYLKIDIDFFDLKLILIGVAVLCVFGVMMYFMKTKETEKDDGLSGDLLMHSAIGILVAVTLIIVGLIP